MYVCILKLSQAIVDNTPNTKLIIANKFYYAYVCKHISFTDAYNIEYTTVYSLNSKDTWQAPEKITSRIASVCRCVCMCARMCMWVCVYGVCVCVRARAKMCASKSRLYQINETRPRSLKIQQNKSCIGIQANLGSSVETVNVQQKASVNNIHVVQWSSATGLRLHLI